MFTKSLRGFLSPSKPRPATRFAQSRRWASSQRPAKCRDRFSVLATGGVSKRAVLDRVSARQLALEPASRDGPSSLETNAVAVLISRDLARWLDDTEFMSSLLARLRLGPADGSPATGRDISVLAAAVDGLCPLTPSGPPSSGLSVVQGDLGALLPGLWDAEDGRQEPPRGAAAQPSLSMRLNPLLGDFRPVDVTLPLANTVFQNARPFTLLASRWSLDAAAPAPSPTLSHLAAKTTQRIAPSHESIQAHAEVSVPLFPITAPRKILTGLGNIVRQLEAGGGGQGGGARSSPASEELELNIQTLINARAKVFPDNVAPIRTWALVVPERAACLDFLRGLPVSVDGQNAGVESEHHRAEAFARHSSKILANGGRLHRVLSGGGGWGLKKGLLSLDPQLTYSTIGDQDLDSFIASFGGEQTADSIVTPGSYVQFFVEALAPAQSGGHLGHATRGPPPPLLLGTAPDGETEPYVGTAHDPPETGSVEIVDGHFGALSSQGIFTNMTPKAESAEVHGTSATHSKIDAPHSYVWEGSGRWI